MVPVTGGTGSVGGAVTPTVAPTAPDLGGLLARSPEATGIDSQRRNPIVSDTRIRGLRNGQFLALADGAPFYPARLDLDSPASKFYPGMIKQVNVVRGPYTALLGPGFSFLDIQTVSAERTTDGTTRFGGVTSLGYQSNGNQWNALQVLTAAGPDFGARVSYNILQGNDYRAGNGARVPASYLSNNFNFALLYALSDKTTVEFKGIRTFQDDLELPGLYFDIARSDTEGYNLKLASQDFGPLDLLTLDLWFNSTAGSGNTRGGAKQAFVNELLRQAFEEPFTQAGAGERGFRFRDSSTTRYAERSIGYRLTGQWGTRADEPVVRFGTDINVFGQGLTENIRFQQLLGPAGQRPAIATLGMTALDPVTGLPRLEQNQSIPRSDAVTPGLFVESSVPLGERLTGRGGGRIDYARTSANPARITGNVNLFGAPGQTPGNRVPFIDPLEVSPLEYSSNRNNGDLSRTFTLLAGFLAADYQISEAASLSLSYGYAERAPTLTELYAAGPFVGVLQQGTSRLIGDPNLKKERLNQFDVVLKYQTEYLVAGGRGFYAFINDYITYDANKLSRQGLTQVVFTNTDLATLAGTELYLTTRVNRWLDPFATLSFVQGVDQTHVDRRRPAGLVSSRRKDPATGSFATDTEPLPQIPPLESRLGFRIHKPTNSLLETPKWQVEFNTRIVNGQSAVATSLGEQRTPGFTTFDIRGFWLVVDEPKRQWVLTAGVENLGDRLYREHLDPIASNLLAARGNGVASLFRPGANFFVTTELRY